MTELNYGFVPFEPQQLDRESFEDYAHDRLRADLHHGQWTFCLTNTTQMLINTGTTEEGYEKKDPREEKGEEREKNKHLYDTNLYRKDFLKSKRQDDWQGTPVIPGSSLKGMIRSVYEILSHACITKISEKYTSKNEKNRDRKDDEKEHFDYEPLKSKQLTLRPCKQGKGLCPACRLFGTLLEKTPDFPMSSWKGRVFIGDGLLELPKASVTQNERELYALKRLPNLFSPQPKRSNNVENVNYYPGGALAGRKRYYQGQQAGASNKEYPWGQVLKTGRTFTFQVRYQNLTAGEVGLLLHAIRLEEGLLHQIGTGKAYGWGACSLSLAEWQTMDLKTRYQGKSSGIEKVPEDERDNKAMQYLDIAKETGLYHPQAFEKLKPFLVPKSS